MQQKRNGLPARHELKYFINPAELEALRARLRPALACRRPILVVSGAQLLRRPFGVRRDLSVSRASLLSGFRRLRQRLSVRGAVLVCRPFGLKPLKRGRTRGPVHLKLYNADSRACKKQRGNPNRQQE